MTAPGPLISVLLPVRNGAAFLEQAVRSILDQTERRFELLVVDDGSTDATPDLITRLAAGDDRIRPSRACGEGLSRLCNAAARTATGRFLARMDADDVATPDRFARQLAWLEAHPECVAVGGQAVRIDPDGWPIDDWRVPLEHAAIDGLHLRGFGGGLIHPCAMIRREAFDRVGGYDESLDAAQDFDLWLKLAEVGRLANLPEVLLYYRLHANSVTCSRRLRQVRCIQSAHAAALRRRGLAGTHPPEEWNALEELTPHRARRQWVRFALRAGRHATALKHARQLWADTRPNLWSFALLGLARLAHGWSPGPAGPIIPPVGADGSSLASPAEGAVSRP
jgi:glycosyltransferase involved in cell wall biosynthesis